MPCIQRQTSHSVRAEIQRKRRKDPCSLPSATSLARDRSLNQRDYLFFFAHNDLAWSLHSTITRRIVWRSAERRLSIPERIGREGNVGAFCPLSQHRLRTCLSSWGIAGDKSSAASPFLPSLVRCRGSTRERVTLRFRSRRCAPHTSRRSSHHCGTRDKGALNVLKTPRTGSAHSPNRSLRTRTPFFSPECTHGVCADGAFCRERRVVECTSFRIHTEKRWELTFRDPLDISKEKDLKSLNYLRHVS